MVVISIINIQRKNFQGIKSLFEKLFFESKILEKKKNWVNYCQEERINQDLTSIMFEVDWNVLPQVIQVLLKNRIQFQNQDKQQSIEIGVNTNTINLLNIKAEDRDLVLNGLKGYKNESPANSNDLSLKFDGPLLQAQALETMLNFIQIEDYTLQQVFLLDLSSTINEVELENTLSRIKSKLDTKVQVQTENINNCTVQINRKRKASDSQTEEISKLYEKKAQKVDKDESMFSKRDLVQMFLLFILFGMLSCIIKGKKLF